MLLHTPLDSGTELNLRRECGHGVLVHCWMGFTRAWCMARMANRVFGTPISESLVTLGITTGSTPFVENYLNSSCTVPNFLVGLVLI